MPQVFLQFVIEEFPDHTNLLFFMWASTRETLSLGFANNNGIDQPARPCSLISTFIICLLKCSLATSDFLNFLASV